MLHFHFFFFQNFIYLFLAVLGLCCCVDFSCREGGYSLVAVCGFLTAVVSLAERRPQGVQALVATHGLSSWSTRAQLLHGMWDLGRPGIKPVSPAVAGRFFTTEPPEKPCIYFLMVFSLFPEPQQKGSKQQICSHSDSPENEQQISLLLVFLLEVVWHMCAPPRALEAANTLTGSVNNERALYRMSCCMRAPDMRLAVT